MSKKIYLVFIIFFLSTIYYFYLNPYHYRNFICKNKDNNLVEKLSINIYFPRFYEVVFKNQIYSKDKCKFKKKLKCSIFFGNNEVDQFLFDTNQQSLEHYWERYDSGMFVYDQTQIIKTKIRDFYSCE